MLAYLADPSDPANITSARFAVQTAITKVEASALKDHEDAALLPGILQMVTDAEAAGPAAAAAEVLPAVAEAEPDLYGGGGLSDWA